MDVTVYTFEDADGAEQGYHTYDATDAKQTAEANGWRVIANEYEWVDSESVEGWDFTGSEHQGFNEALDEVMPTVEDVEHYPGCDLDGCEHEDKPVVYTIPTVIDGPHHREALGIKEHARVNVFGDVDYGPNYGVDDIVMFTKEVTAEEAAELYGRYLAGNYQDAFRQVEVLRMSGSNDGRCWTLRVHIAWGDGHYTPV